MEGQFVLLLRKLFRRCYRCDAAIDVAGGDAGSAAASVRLLRRWGR